MLELGRIEKVDIKDVWPNEAANFTPWLAKNLDLLGEELGLDLELDRTEAPVGSFSLDILAREVNRNAVVAIENQIAGTDHMHLGQLMTYAAGYSAGVVIWVATDFRDEHRAALDWLNEHTDEETQFFGAAVEVWKIGDSLRAPHFRLAAAPNSWSKQVKVTSKTDLSEKQQRYVQFWKPLLEELNNKHGWNIKTDNIGSYFDAGSGLGAGFGRFGRSMRFTIGGEARVELLFLGPTKEWNKNAFDLLKESQEQIEEKLGALNWDRLGDAKISRVGVSRSGSIEDSEEELAEIRSWMIDYVQRFPDTFHPYLEDVLKRVQE